MKTNSAGLDLIKNCEGLRLEAYKNKGERNYTIGYGHSDSTIKKGDVITKERAEQYLISDLEKFENYVTKYAVKKFPDLNENQFSALVSYCYNRGPKGLKELVDNSKNITEMGFNLWVYWGTNKNYEKGLKARRTLEQKLFYRDYVTIPDLPKHSCNFPVPKPVLKRGCRGMQVEYLQRFLNTFSFMPPLKIDGIFGENTYTNLMIYQREHKLLIDGIYGPQTYGFVKNVMEG